MRRPHPYLAIALVCAAVVLATAAMLACPARCEVVSYNDGCNECWRDTETGMGGCTLLACTGMDGKARQAPVPIGPRTPPPAPAPAPVVTSVPVVNGIAIWPGSPECEVFGPITYYPTLERVREIQLAARWAIAKELDAGAIGWNGITPEGLKTPMSGLEWQAVLAFTYENVPTFYDRPRFGTYKPWPGATPNCSVGDTPMVCICAQGVGRIHPEIALDQPLRTERLIAWETLNSLVCAVRRCDLGDSAYISTLMTAIEPRVGGWRTR